MKKLIQFNFWVMCITFLIAITSMTTSCMFIATTHSAAALLATVFILSVAWCMYSAVMMCAWDWKDK